MTLFEITIFGLDIAPTYYGLMYVIGFLYGIWALKKTGKYSEKQRESLFLFIFLGVVFGGRLGYILFYNFGAYMQNPLSMLKVWEGGMSFHGGFLGVAMALYFFAKKQQISFWSLGDDIAKIIPIGLFFGRIGNYLNKELLGFDYSGPLAVVTSSGRYFPSPLIEALLEGVLLFVIFNFILKKPKFSGQFALLFLILYGLSRTFVELFIRTPDQQIGYYFGYITQGSLLSIPMIGIGGVLYYYLSKKKFRCKTDYYNKNGPFLTDS